MHILIYVLHVYTPTTVHVDNRPLIPSLNSESQSWQKKCLNSPSHHSASFLFHFNHKIITCWSFRRPNTKVCKHYDFIKISAPTIQQQTVFACFNYHHSPFLFKKKSFHIAGWLKLQVMAPFLQGRGHFSKKWNHRAVVRF